MLNAWFAFSANGKKRSDLKIAFLFALIAPLQVFAAETVDLTQLPEADVRAVTKNSTGDQVQIGDRIPLLVDIKPEWIKGTPEFSLTVPEGSSKLTDLGWYMDPDTLWVAGSIRITVSPIKPGKLTLPTLVVSLKDPTPLAIARTQPFSVTVLAPEKDKNSKIDLIDPQSIPLAKKYIFYGLLLAVILTSLILALYRRFRQRKADAPQTPPQKTEEPEHVIAMKRLETIFKDYPHSADAAKPIAFGVSEILKDFFSRRFEIDAAESTTPEMLSLLKSIGMGAPELSEVSTFFGELDQIKFVSQSLQNPYTEETHQRLQIKSMALVQRWAKQPTGSAPQ